MAEKPGKGPHHEGVFSIVGEQRQGTLRRLPSLYFGRQQVFADRNIELVADRLECSIEAVIHAKKRPTYEVHACSLGERPGLYARDPFNRSSYRVKLGRLGMIFAKDPYTRLTPDANFECNDWGPFRPTFVVAAAQDTDPSVVVGVTPGLVAFSFAARRLGFPQAREISTLVRALRGVPALGASDPVALVEHLRNKSKKR